MIEQRKLHDILTCVIAVVIFIFQSLNYFFSWIKIHVSHRGNTTTVVTADTTISSDAKPNDKNTLENFIRVQELIQKHFDIPLLVAEEEPKVNVSIPDTVWSTPKKSCAENDECGRFVDRVIDDCYVARGLGLIAGTVGRQTEFYLYSKYGDDFDGVFVELRGRNGETGSTTIGPNRRLAVGSVRSNSATIPVDYAYDVDRIKVTYTPVAEGVHTLTLSRNDVSVCRSPYYISVEKSPTNSRSKIRLGTKKYRTVSKFGKGKTCPAPETKAVDNTITVTETAIGPPIVVGSSPSPPPPPPPPPPPIRLAREEKDYVGTDVKSIVTKFESKSIFGVGKKTRNRMSSVTEKSPENDLSDGNVTAIDARSKIDYSETVSVSSSSEMKTSDSKIATDDSGSNDGKFKTDYARPSNADENPKDNRTATERGEARGCPIDGVLRKVNLSATRLKPPTDDGVVIDQSETERSCKIEKINELLKDQNNTSAPASDGDVNRNVVTDANESSSARNEESCFDDDDRRTVITMENSNESESRANDFASEQYWAQYDVKTPFTRVISKITNDACEKCFKNIFKTLSEVPKDVNIKHTKNSNEIRSSFETLLAQPIRININIDNVYENATNQLKNTHLHYENSENVRRTSTVGGSIKCDSPGQTEKTLRTDREGPCENINTTNETSDNAITVENVTNTVSDENRVIIENAIDEDDSQILTNDNKSEKCSEDVSKECTFGTDNVHNTESNRTLLRLQNTDVNNGLNVLLNDRIAEKTKQLNDISEESDSTSDIDNSSEKTKTENVNETINNDESELINTFALCENSTLQSCVINDTVLASIKVTLASTENKNSNVERDNHNESENRAATTNRDLNQKLMIEKSIEPVINNFKVNMVEQILQLCMNREGSSNTNYAQLSNTYINNKEPIVTENNDVGKSLDNETSAIRVLNKTDDETLENKFGTERNDFKNLLKAIENMMKKNSPENENNSELITESKLKTIVNTAMHCPNDLNRSGNDDGTNTVRGKTPNSLTTSNTEDIIENNSKIIKTDDTSVSLNIKSETILPAALFENNDVTVQTVNSNMEVTAEEILSNNTVVHEEQIKYTATIKETLSTDQSSGLNIQNSGVSETLNQIETAFESRNSKDTKIITLEKGSDIITVKTETQPELDSKELVSITSALVVKNLDTADSITTEQNPTKTKSINNNENIDTKQSNYQKLNESTKTTTIEEDSTSSILNTKTIQSAILTLLPLNENKTLAEVNKNEIGKDTDFKMETLKNNETIEQNEKTQDILKDPSNKERELTLKSLESNDSEKPESEVQNKIISNNNEFIEINEMEQRELKFKSDLSEPLCIETITVQSSTLNSTASTTVEHKNREELTTFSTTEKPNDIEAITAVIETTFITSLVNDMQHTTIEQTNAAETPNTNSAKTEFIKNENMPETQNEDTTKTTITEEGTTETCEIQNVDNTEFIEITKTHIPIKIEDIPLEESTKTEIQMHNRIESRVLEITNTGILEYDSPGLNDKSIRSGNEKTLSEGDILKQYDDAFVKKTENTLVVQNSTNPKLYVETIDTLNTNNIESVVAKSVNTSQIDISSEKSVSDNVEKITETTKIQNLTDLETKFDTLISSYVENKIEENANVINIEKGFEEIKSDDTIIKQSPCIEIVSNCIEPTMIEKRYSIDVKSTEDRKPDETEKVFEKSQTVSEPPELGSTELVSTEEDHTDETQRLDDVKRNTEGVVTTFELKKLDAGEIVVVEPKKKFVTDQTESSAEIKILDAELGSMAEPQILIKNKTEIAELEVIQEVQNSAVDENVTVESETTTEASVTSETPKSQEKEAKIDDENITSEKTLLINAELTEPDQTNPIAIESLQESENFEEEITESEPQILNESKSIALELDDTSQVTESSKNSAVLIKQLNTSQAKTADEVKELDDSKIESQTLDDSIIATVKVGAIKEISNLAKDGNITVEAGTTTECRRLSNIENKLVEEAEALKIDNALRIQVSNNVEAAIPMIETISNRQTIDSTETVSVEIASIPETQNLQETENGVATTTDKQIISENCLVNIVESIDREQINSVNPENPPTPQISKGDEEVTEAAMIESATNNMYDTETVHLEIDNVSKTTAELKNTQSSAIDQSNRNEMQTTDEAQHLKDCTIFEGKNTTESQTLNVNITTALKVKPMQKVENSTDDENLTVKTESATEITLSGNVEDTLVEETETIKIDNVSKIRKSVNVVTAISTLEITSDAETIDDIETISIDEVTTIISQNLRESEYESKPEVEDNKEIEQMILVNIENTSESQEPESTEEIIEEAKTELEPQNSKKPETSILKIDETSKIPTLSDDDEHIVAIRQSRTTQGRATDEVQKLNVDKTLGVNAQTVTDLRISNENITTTEKLEANYAISNSDSDESVTVKTEMITKIPNSCEIENDLTETIEKDTYEATIIEQSNTKCARISTDNQSKNVIKAQDMDTKSIGKPRTSIENTAGIVEVNAIQEVQNSADDENVTAETETTTEVSLLSNIESTLVEETKIMIIDTTPETQKFGNNDTDIPAVEITSNTQTDIDNNQTISLEVVDKPEIQELQDKEVEIEAKHKDDKNTSETTLLINAESTEPDQTNSVAIENLQKSDNIEETTESENIESEPQNLNESETIVLEIEDTSQTRPSNNYEPVLVEQLNTVHVQTADKVQKLDDGITLEVETETAAEPQTSNEDVVSTIVVEPMILCLANDENKTSETATTETSLLCNIENTLIEEAKLMNIDNTQEIQKSDNKTDISSSETTYNTQTIDNIGTTSTVVVATSETLNLQETKNVVVTTTVDDEIRCENSLLNNTTSTVLEQITSANQKSEQKNTADDENLPETLNLNSNECTTQVTNESQVLNSSELVIETQVLSNNLTLEIKRSNSVAQQAKVKINESDDFTGITTDNNKTFELHHIENTNHSGINAQHETQNPKDTEKAIVNVQKKIKIPVPNEIITILEEIKTVNLETTLKKQNSDDIKTISQEIETETEKKVLKDSETMSINVTSETKKSDINETNLLITETDGKSEMTSLSKTSESIATEHLSTTHVQITDEVQKLDDDLTHEVETKMITEPQTSNENVTITTEIKAINEVSNLANDDNVTARLESKIVTSLSCNVENTLVEETQTTKIDTSLEVQKSDSENDITIQTKCNTQTIENVETVFKETVTATETHNLQEVKDTNEANIENNTITPKTSTLIINVESTELEQTNLVKIESTPESQELESNVGTIVEAIIESKPQNKDKSGTKTVEIDDTFKTPESSNNTESELTERLNIQNTAEVKKLDDNKTLDVNTGNIAEFQTSNENTTTNMEKENIQKIPNLVIDGNTNGEAKIMTEIQILCDTKTGSKDEPETKEIDTIAEIRKQLQSTEDKYEGNQNNSETTLVTDVESIVLERKFLTAIGYSQELKNVEGITEPEPRNLNEPETIVLEINNTNQTTESSNNTEPTLMEPLNTAHTQTTDEVETKIKTMPQILNASVTATVEVEATQDASNLANDDGITVETDTPTETLLLSNIKNTIDEDTMKIDTTSEIRKLNDVKTVIQTVDTVSNTQTIENLETGPVEVISTIETQNDSEDNREAKIVDDTINSETVLFIDDKPTALEQKISVAIESSQESERIEKKTGSKPQNLYELETIVLEIDDTTQITESSNNDESTLMEQLNKAQTQIADEVQKFDNGIILEVDTEIMTETQTSNTNVAPTLDVEPTNEILTLTNDESVTTETVTIETLLSCDIENTFVKEIETIKIHAKSETRKSDDAATVIQAAKTASSTQTIDSLETGSVEVYTISETQKLLDAEDNHEVIVADYTISSDSKLSNYFELEKISTVEIDYVPESHESETTVEMVESEQQNLDDTDFFGIDITSKALLNDIEIEALKQLNEIQVQITDGVQKLDDETRVVNAQSIAESLTMNENITTAVEVKPIQMVRISAFDGNGKMENKTTTETSLLCNIKNGLEGETGSIEIDEALISQKCIDAEINVEITESKMKKNKLDDTETISIQMNATSETEISNENEQTTNKTHVLLETQKSDNDQTLTAETDDISVTTSLSNDIESAVLEESNVVPILTSVEAQTVNEIKSLDVESKCHTEPQISNECVTTIFEVKAVPEAQSFTVNENVSAKDVTEIPLLRNIEFTPIEETSTIKTGQTPVIQKSNDKGMIVDVKETLLSELQASNITETTCEDSNLNTETQKSYEVDAVTEKSEILSETSSSLNDKYIATESANTVELDSVQENPNDVAATDNNEKSEIRNRHMFEDSFVKYEKPSDTSVSRNKNVFSEKSFGIQKLEMSVQRVKTSDEDYFEKTFLSLEQTEKISLKKNTAEEEEEEKEEEEGEETTIEDKLYTVNESDLNAIICASSLQEALTLLDSKIKFKFKKIGKSSKKFNTTRCTNLHTSTSNENLKSTSSSSEKNVKFTEAQEFFKKIEKQSKK